MTKRALVLIIVCIGLAAGWFLMNEDPAPKAKVSKAKQATQKVKKDSKKPSEHEVPARTKKNAPPLTSDEAQIMLIGIWRIDLDSLANDPEVKGAPEEEREDALRMAKSMMRNVAFEFAQDKTMNLFLSSHVRKGTYAVTQAKDNLLTIDHDRGIGQHSKNRIHSPSFAEALELTDVKNQITRRLVRGAPPTPGEAPPKGEGLVTPRNRAVRSSSS